MPHVAEDGKEDGRHGVGCVGAVLWERSVPAETVIAAQTDTEPSKEDDP